MFKGSVDFVAQIKGNRLTFPRFDFNPHEPGVDKVEIEGLDGDVIRSTVHLATVASPDDGMVLAAKVNTAALNRIAFYHNIAIENARCTRDDFSPLHPQPSAPVLVAGTGRYSLTGSPVNFSIGLSAERLKAELEHATPPGEHNYGLFRSVRQSTGPVEEFMHLYNILLMLYNDKQADVDAFIIAEDSSVPQTQHPLKARGEMETVYTRLRNELAHQRAGVNPDDTKVEMAHRLCDLIMLTKRAIELRP